MALMKNIPVIPSNAFDDYLPVERKFLAEASTLQHHFRIDRIFDDACDVGFKIRSAKTDNTEVFVLTEIERDSDGDIAWWKFKSLNAKLNVSVTVFND